MEFIVIESFTYTDKLPGMNVGDIFGIYKLLGDGVSVMHDVGFYSVPVYINDNDYSIIEGDEVFENEFKI